MKMETLLKLVPSSKVAELFPGKQYVIQVNRDVNMGMMNDLMKHLKKHNISAILCRGDVAFYEVAGQEPRDGKLTIRRLDHEDTQEVSASEEHPRKGSFKGEFDT